MRHIPSVLATATLFVVAAACSGGSDLFSDGATTTGGGVGGDVTTSTNTGGFSATTTTTTVTTSTTSTGGAPATTVTTGGTMNVGGGGMGQGGDEPDGKLECGANLCPVAVGSACCWDEDELYGEPRAECVMGDFTNDGCNTGVTGDPEFGYETRIECQNDTHCDVGVCCAARRFSQTQGTLYINVECVDVTACDEIQGGTEMCIVPGSTDGCPVVQTQQGTVQTVCKQSSLLPDGYLICGQP